jgi:hypothetical protein
MVSILFVTVTKCFCMVTATLDTTETESRYYFCKHMFVHLTYVYDDEP